jgi:hypothetical protein
MVVHTFVISVVMVICVSFIPSVAVAGGFEPSEKETIECNQQLKRIRTWDDSLAPGPVNDLAQYERNANVIQQHWSQQNKQCYARLMLAICSPLSSGRFKSGRQYELARKYALSALENPDAIPLDLELELTGHVMTPTLGPGVPKEKDFMERRRKDVEIHLHAWKRLANAVDVNWNSNEIPQSPNAVAADMGFPGTIVPEGIKDASLRAKYEAAIEKNRQKIDRYTEQYKLRLVLKTFPMGAESYIIQAYSHPPYNIEELKKSLNEYKVDENTKARILGAVTKNCDKEKK